MVNLGVFMTINKKSSGSSSKIDEVKSSVGELQAQNHSGWANIFKSLNVLGTISEAYAKTLAYRVEVKRLEAEQKRIEAQAKIIHDGIEKNYQLKMEELKTRRMELEAFYITLNKELEQTHIERMTILKMAQSLQEQVSLPNISLEERLLFKDFSLECIRDLSNLGDKSTVRLQSVIEALPKIGINNLLEE